ncbi:ABC transporter substrate-binding protein, partial [Thermodesulfobacteriota bacterium]
AAAMAKQFKALNFPALMIGVCDPLCVPAAWKATRGAVQGMVGIVMGAGHMPVKQIPRSVEFYNNYLKKYGEPVGLTLGAAEAYDSVYVMVNALERAGSLDPDKIIMAIEATDLSGAMGKIKFNPKDHAAIWGSDPAQAGVQVLFQWIDGNRVPVFPNSVAEAKIKLR